MTLSEAIRHRRMAHARRDRAVATAALFDTANSFRRQAEAQVNAGHPELAEPFLDEAELFESAARSAPGL
jgi:hypothetical protein